MNMPNWKIHLEVGKRLNNYLKYDDVGYNDFLLGNILPDINNCYIVKDIKKRIGHATTHFDDNESFKHHLAFLSKYQDRLHEPIYLGYYVHLYTDYLFNHTFYNMIKKRKLDYIEKDTLRIMKQHDFKLFNNKYIDNTIKLDNIDETLNKIDIKEVDVCKEDLENVIKYLNNTPEYNGEYKFYTDEEMEEVLNIVVDKIIDNIKTITK